MAVSIFPAYRFIIPKSGFQSRVSEAKIMKIWQTFSRSSKLKLIKHFSVFELYYIEKYQFFTSKYYPDQKSIQLYWSWNQILRQLFFSFHEAEVRQFFQLTRSWIRQKLQVFVQLRKYWKYAIFFCYPLS